MWFWLVCFLLFQMMSLKMAALLPPSGQMFEHNVNVVTLSMKSVCCRKHVVVRMWLAASVHLSYRRGQRVQTGSVPLAGQSALQLRTPVWRLHRCVTLDRHGGALRLRVSSVWAGLRVWWKIWKLKRRTQFCHWVKQWNVCEHETEKNFLKNVKNKL